MHICLDLQAKVAKNNLILVKNKDWIVKIGSTTGKTFVRFEMNEPAISVKTIKHLWDFDECKIILHNQLGEIPIVNANGEQIKFAGFGDSGSLVLRKVEDNDYVCFGMAEGGTSGGRTIVTHISPILESSNISRYKSFETENLFMLRTEMK